MKFSIRFYGDPVLRKKSETVTEINDEIRKLGADLIETMYEEDGIGLAASQVGILKRMIAVDAGENRGNPLILINPEVISVKGKVVMEEGCLSFPGIYGNIERAKSAAFKAMNIEGKDIVMELEGLECRAMFHEIDHLDGVLFIDKMSPSHKIVIKSKLKKLKKETLKGLK